MPIQHISSNYENTFEHINALIEANECNQQVTLWLTTDIQASYNHEFAHMNIVIDNNIRSQYNIWSQYTIYPSR